jgi:dTDP-4-dehydrorhamnose 3,5-epimerase
MTNPVPSKFKVTALALPEVLLVSGPTFFDGRGHFSETFRKNDFAALGIGCDFVQENMSRSAGRGTVRGLHFQGPPHAQAKLVQVVSGAIYDVAVDIRKGSPRFGQWCGATLKADNNEHFFVPRGFAHGFCCLEDNTIVAYKVDNYYDRDSEGGIIWDDADLAIKWPIGVGEPLLSDKDAKLPRFAEFVSPFVFEG